MDWGVDTLSLHTHIEGYPINNVGKPSAPSFDLMFLEHIVSEGFERPNNRNNILFSI